MFRKALQETAAHHSTTEQIADVSGILQTLSDSLELRNLWKKYRKQFAYAENIEFEQLLEVLKLIATRFLFEMYS